MPRGNISLLDEECWCWLGREAELPKPDLEDLEKWEKKPLLVEGLVSSRGWEWDRLWDRELSPWCRGGWRCGRLGESTGWCSADVIGGNLSAPFLSLSSSSSSKSSSAREVLVSAVLRAVGVGPAWGFLVENLLKGERGVLGDDRESKLGGEVTWRVSAECGCELVSDAAEEGSESASGCGTILRPMAKARSQRHGRAG